MFPEGYNLSFKRIRRTAREDNRHGKFTLVISIVVFMCNQRCIFYRNFVPCLYCFDVWTKWPWRVKTWTVCPTERLVRTTRAVWRRDSDFIKSSRRHLFAERDINDCKKVCEVLNAENDYEIVGRSLLRNKLPLRRDGMSLQGSSAVMFWAQTTSGNEIAWHIWRDTKIAYHNFTIFFWSCILKLIYYNSCRAKAATKAL